MGLRFRAKVSEVLDDFESEIENNPTRKKFRLKVGEDEYEEIMTYNEVLRHIESQNRNDEEPMMWKFKQIVGHQGPLNKDSPGWKGDRYNVMVEWENGETSYEPL